MGEWNNVGSVILGEAEHEVGIGVQFGCWRRHFGPAQDYLQFRIFDRSIAYGWGIMRLVTVT
jgi:hypothetical protein